MMSFGENLREQRKRKGLTQMQLAALIGTSQGMIYQYESSMKTPKKETIKKIAEALDVAPAVLDNDFSVNADLRNVYCIGSQTVEVPKGSIHDQVLGLCRELSDAGIAEWIALGNTIKDFPHNKR